MQCPQELIPCYDSELLKKLEVMVKRAAVYMVQLPGGRIDSAKLGVS